VKGLLARYLARARAMRFHYLLASLILLLAVYPYVSAGPTGPAALKVLSSFVLITGVYAVSNRRRQVVVAALLAVPAFGLGWLHVITGNPALGAAENIFTLLFYAFTALIGLLQVLGERRITTDTIYGAVSVYLLMGLTWATALRSRRERQSRVVLGRVGRQRLHLSCVHLLQFRHAYDARLRRHHAGHRPGPVARRSRDGERDTLHRRPDRPPGGGGRMDAPDRPGVRVSGKRD
jgi:hypothetical protein